MATQTDVQQLIQGLAPNGNNGNPNTVYNSAPGIPMMDGNGNWFLQQLPTAASINLTRMAQTGGMGGGAAFPGFQLPPLGSNGTGGTAPVFPNLPPIGNPGQPTIPTTPPIVVGGGGGTSSGSIGGGYTEDIINLNGLNTGVGRGAVGGNVPSSAYRPSNGSAGLGGNGLWGSSPWLANKLGVEATGGMDWQQLLDVITEPFMPGDFYQSKTDTYNTQAAGATAGGILGGGLGRLIGNMLGKTDANTQNLIQNYLSGRLSQSQATMGNSLDAKTQAGVDKLIADAIAKFGGTVPVATANTSAFSNGVGMGNNAKHWGATGYDNDAPFGAVAAGFGLGAAGNGASPNNRQTGTDARGRTYEY